ncbi:MAG: PAS domain S-box protein [Gemmataceae bacterium]
MGKNLSNNWLMSQIASVNLPEQDEQVCILIVDDEEPIRNLLHQLLQAEGYLCVAVSSGEEALELLKSDMFDVMMVDLAMPGIGGLEVLRRLRTMDCQVVPIVLTSHSDVASAIEAMKLEAFDFLGKPEGLCSLRMTVIKAAEFGRIRRKTRSMERLVVEWQTTFDACPDLMLVLNHKRVVMRCNRAFAHRLDQSPEQLVGFPIQSLLPSDRGIGGLLAGMGDVPSGIVSPQDVYDERLAGEFLVTISPQVVEPGASPGVVVVAHDITDRKLAEQAVQLSEARMRAVVDTAVDAIVTICERGLIESINPAVVRLFGYSSREVLGKNISMLMPDPYRGEHDRYLKDYIQSGLRKIIGIGREVMAQRKDGTQFPIELAVSEVNLENRTLFVGIMRDISERRLAEETRKLLLQKILSAQEEERRRLSRELHDGIGQSLLSLRVGLQSLHKQICEGQLRDRVHQLSEATATTIEEVRNMSQGLRPSVLDDLGLAASLERLTDSFTRQYGITIDLLTMDLVTTRYSQEIETALYRIIQEALTNVVRHARANLVSVILEHPGAELGIIIEDDGVGFDLEAMRHGQDPNKHLGLSGMRERADLLGGTMTIESSPGQGTTIRVRLPLKPG